MADFTMKPRNLTEADLQFTVVEWLELQESMGRLTFFSVPNEGRRSFPQAAKMKRMGLRSGVPDLCVLSNKFCGFIELKTPKGKMRDSQVEWAERLTRFRINYALCRTFEEVEGTINGWLGKQK